MTLDVSAGSLPKRLAQLVRARLDRLRGQARAAGWSSDDSVHEIRLVCKEFRAYLGLLHESELERFRKCKDKQLAAIARGLAPNRDRLVIRETLERLARKSAKRAARRAVHGIVLQLGERDSVTLPTRARITRATRKLQRVALEICRRLVLRLTSGALIDAIAVQYRRLRRLSGEARRRPGGRSWHEWRKQAKSLHYQVNWLIDLWPARLKGIARETWSLQARLGDYHDLRVTRKRLKGLWIAPNSEPCRKLAVDLINHRIRKLERQLKRETAGLLCVSASAVSRKLRKRVAV